MPYLQINDKQVQLRPGETRIGVGSQVEVRLPPTATADASGALAVVDLGRDSVAIRRAGPDAVVRVNGVQLGAEPTPLLHGDKIEIAGAELYYGDDRRGGSTQFIPMANVADLPRLRSPLPGRATAATGGRIISLVDGREYSVGLAGLVLGRDASCDVVIPSAEVSRRHAEIVAGDSGYVVTDTSTNGLFVNGERIEGAQVLGRGDILRIGTEEFRFYADAAPAAADVVAKAGPGARADAGAATRPGPSGGVSAAPPAASGGLPAAAPAAPAALPAAAAPAPDASPAAGPESGRHWSREAIAMLEMVGSGVLRGRRFPVSAVLAHVGRGEHNDVVIPDESISDSHAKLQRRDGVWYVTDLGSTNGTYVAGRRIASEERLDEPADLRLGGVKLSFTALTPEPMTSPRGATRQFSAGIGPAPVRRAAPVGSPGGGAVPPRAPAPSRERLEGERPASTTGRGAPWFWWVVGAAAVAGAVYLIKGR